ncbi:hypothetical protein EDEG_01659 [Edhazardia aedis USNM 41457]|uniref:Cell division control protein 73 C-terminal domain-containing protein n=1 Tax=Edhazardia aedis (strain USNM 41457) TaxID=1003232 RepID=J9DNB2_EDHAE|nr:hypothetical protein EDEG_01659 [Edhazardia aedis USNM 41457]|eukprot:EJW04025.1 hypothetical protein EDEG_01659 [Edhazardia aedis USNM 41457]
MNDFRLFQDDTKFETCVQKEKSVNFDCKLSKKYTFKCILFFAKNSRIPFSDYVEQCKRENIEPIDITDSEPILNELNYINIPKIDVIYPAYASSQNYAFLEKIDISEDITKVRLFNIIVPQSVTSNITLANIEDFLLKGLFVPADIEDTLGISDNVKFFNNLDNIKYRFNVVSDPSLFCKKDWDQTVCIFVDECEWALNMWGVTNLNEIFKEVPAFRVRLKSEKNDPCEKYDVRDFIIDKKTLHSVDVKLIWDAIKYKINHILKS